MGCSLMDSLGPSVPSIPTRFQGTGYEENNNGTLVLQDAVEPGFDGTKYNSVGPGDYEPKMDFVKYKHAPKVNMKGSDRNQIYRQLEKAGGQAPGPGYYNQRGEFDKFDDSDQTNYLVRLHAAKTKLSASFASGSSRNAMLNAELKPKIGNPGPGAYFTQGRSKSSDFPEKDGPKLPERRRALSKGKKCQRQLSAGPRGFEE